MCSMLVFLQARSPNARQIAETDKADESPDYGMNYVQYRQYASPIQCDSASPGIGNI